MSARLVAVVVVLGAASCAWRMAGTHLGSPRRSLGNPTDGSQPCHTNTLGHVLDWEQEMELNV
jgi:hypothetical protein